MLFQAEPRIRHIGFSPFCSATSRHCQRYSRHHCPYPGGATGYGIQLVWGDALTSSTGIPSDTVIFDAPNVVSTQTFTPGVTPAPVQVKLAARYVPTGETKSPGLANSAIEILANYN
jgi:hypothetical protein